jgi:glycerol uptake facilitator-like aquaporin
MTWKTARAMLLTAVVLACTLVAGLATADATTIVKIASHISIKGKGLTFSGAVTSVNPACDAGRKVTLYRTNGNVLGSTTTGSAGHWKITASGSAGITLGSFFAKVKRRSEGTAGTIYTCKAARSRTIPYHP